MKKYEVAQEYWSVNEPEDCIYYATVIVEAENAQDAEMKACMEGMFDEEYCVPFDELGLGDVIEVSEITEE